MGSIQAIDMAALAPLEKSLSWHLQSNHYPPVPTSMVSVCSEAIDLANEEDWDAEVTLPDGVSYKGRDTAPVWAIIDNHHLQPWLADNA